MKNYGDIKWVVCQVVYKRNVKCEVILLNILVSVPPHQMLIYDYSGADVLGVVGPLEENAALVMVCEVRGGK